MNLTKTQDTSLHQLLKANTTAWHSRLDSTPGLRQLIRPELTLAQYVTALQGLLDAHRRVEHQLQQLVEDHPGICPNLLPVYRSRVPALLSDLSRLASKTAPTSTPSQISEPSSIQPEPETGGDAAANAERSPMAANQSGHQSHLPYPYQPAQSQQSRQSPTASALTGAGSAAQAQAHYLGIRYVLEGATQGGKMISAQVTVQLPRLHAEQAVAYWTLLDAASADWTALAHLLARPAKDAEEVAAISAGAVHAYQCFLDTFDPSPTHQPSRSFRQS
ncbi:MAG: biliverdin-producing heme oxygenase [Lamprobacter sp.]|uniref:biliverdin-producing heme oxygenase n=1 Tax=Lamprobacter sp. TaxID=3100796 RepID=UPI002B25E2CB|nr:biliverdin-producing heme oxygenase [Lamprobacter sp.]MEA3640527.1 biliverdin-producing heme oxygenase [Lamprobacter sp.]